MKFNNRILSRRTSTEHVLDKFEEFSLDRNNFCIVPFTNIILEPNGSVGMCRQKGTEFSIGNLSENSLEEIWNGRAAQKWRGEFLSGRSEICRNEIDYKNCNLCSSNNELLDFTDLSKVQTHPILKLTANFNGFCNLKCQMCDVWKLPNGFYTEDNFWIAARKDIFPHLKEIDMLSGEPFLQQDTFKLINEVSSVNKECLWNITTNAHWSLNDKIKSSLNKINFKNMILSIDSLIPSVYGKIRYPGNLSRVLKTVEELIVYDKSRVSNNLSSLNLNLNFLVQKDNWSEVVSVIEYCNERDIIPFITYCENPSEHSLSTFDLDKKIQILEYYFSLDPFLTTFLMRVIKPLIFSLPPIDRIEYLIQLQKNIDVLNLNLYEV